MPGLIEQVEAVDADDETALQELDALSDERKDLQLQFDSLIRDGVASNADRELFNGEMTFLIKCLGTKKSALIVEGK